MSRSLRGLVVACALLASRHAFAQDIAAAEELYRRGVTDFRAEKFEPACQEFAASYRLDPHPGVLFTLATCEARVGRVATASARYDDFLRLVASLPPEQQAVQAERRDAATRERASLAPQIPRLTIALAEPLPANAVVRRDGAELDAAAFGQSLPVDPGEHVVTIEVAGARGEEERVVVSKGESKTITLHVPQQPPLQPPPAPAPSAAELPHAPATPPRASEVPASPPRRVSPLLYVAGGLGMAGVALGATTGLLALGDRSIVDQECIGPACSARGKEAADRGKTEAIISTIAFGAGAAVLAVTIVLYVIDRAQASGSHGQSAVSLTPGRAEWRF